MKKQILLALSLMITIDLSAQPQDIVVHLARNKTTTITTEELGSLKSKRGTIRNMFEDIPDGFDELHLPDVERSPFKLFMQVQGKTGGALRNELKKLRTRKLYNLIKTANYLEAEELLDASTGKIAQRTVSSKHLDQLLTKSGFDAYYKKIEQQPAELQKKVEQQFVKTKIALSLKKLAKQSSLTFKPDNFSWLAAFDRHQVGQYLVAGTESLISKVRTFMKGELLEFRNGNMLPLWSLAFDLKCTHLAILSIYHKVRVFDIETKERLRQFDDEGGVASIAIDPAGKQLAMGYCDKKVCIFDIKTAGKLLELFSFEDLVRSVVFDSTGKYLVAGTSDNTVPVFDYETYDKLERLDRGCSINSVAIDSTGKYFATSFDLETGKKLKQFDHDCCGVSSVAIDLTGKYLATSTHTIGRRSYIRIFDIKTKEELQWFNCNLMSISLVFDPTGNYLATESGGGKPLIWIVMPAFEKTLQKLTLPEAQMVALVAEKKIQPNAVPKHLEDLYESLPETVRYLLEAQKQEG